MAEQLDLELDTLWGNKKKDYLLKRDRIQEAYQRSADHWDRAKASALSDEFDKDIEDLTVEYHWLKERCQHEDMERNESGYDGSYLDIGYYDRWTKCTFCGYETEKIRTDTGYG